MRNRQIVRVAIGVLVVEIVFTAIRMTPRDPFLALIGAALALATVALLIWRHREQPYTKQRVRAWTVIVVTASLLCASIR